MSLAIIYNGAIVADRCSILEEPNSLGSKQLVKKLHVSGCKRIAFTNVGPTLSADEQLILEEIILSSFKETKGESNEVVLQHPEWLKKYYGMSVFVLTKKSSYVFNRRDSRGKSSESFKLIKYDGLTPLVGGTGMYVASMAVQEGVAMNDITEFVSTIIGTVSAEGDIITQRQLKAMKL